MSKKIVQKSIVQITLYREICSFNLMVIPFLLKGLFGYINCILLIDEKIKCQTVQTSLYTFTDKLSLYVVSLNPQNKTLRIKDSSRIKDLKDEQDHPAHNTGHL